MLNVRLMISLRSGKLDMMVMADKSYDDTIEMKEKARETEKSFVDTLMPMINPHTEGVLDDQKMQTIMDCVKHTSNMLKTPCKVSVQRFNI